MRHAILTLLLVLLLPWTASAQPSASITADMRLWAKDAAGFWSPVVLAADGGLPMSSSGGASAPAQQPPPSASSTTDARLWGKTSTGLWTPVVLDSTGHLPTALGVCGSNTQILFNNSGVCGGFGGFDIGGNGSGDNTANVSLSKVAPTTAIFNSASCCDVFFGADGAMAGFQAFQFHSTPGTGFVGLSARGSRASPSSIQNGDSLTGLYAQGYSSIGGGTYSGGAFYSYAISDWASRRDLAWGLSIGSTYGGRPLSFNTSGLADFRVRGPIYGEGDFSLQYANVIPTAAITGTPGTTFGEYYVVANCPGTTTTAGGLNYANVYNMPATLNGGNFVTLSWTAVSCPGVTYSVYTDERDGTPSSIGLLGTTGSTSFVDNGVAGDGNPLYPDNTTTQFTVTGGTVTAPTAFTAPSFLVTNGGALKTDTTTAHTALIQAYDVNGTTYRTFGTLTNGDVPDLTLSAPAGGTMTVAPSTLTIPSGTSLTGGTVTGLFVANGASPAVDDTSGGNSCGAAGNPSMAANSTNNAGAFVVGAGGGTDCTVTFTVAAAHFWACTPSDETSAVLVRAVSVNTTTTKFQGVLGAADSVRYLCTAY